MMTRTPDDVKKGLECCKCGISWATTCAKGCPYKNVIVPGSRCEIELLKDALALIQHLEEQNAEKAERIRVLESRNNALYHTILGVMHFVDKWLDVPAYDPDEDLNGTVAIGRASQAREITLQAIEQLEKDNDQLRNYIRLLQAERDAAVAELANSDSPCDFCKYLKKFAHETPCNNCVHVLHGEESQFKWRGVQKEETHES